MKADIGFYVDMFADSVGCPHQSVPYDRFISGLPSHLQRYVGTVRRKLQDGGFDGYDGCRVRSFKSADGRIYFFYPVASKNRSNICMPFLAEHTNLANVAMVEGPTVIGIALAAKDLSRKFSADSAAKGLLPQSTIQSSVGSFARGYSMPDKYRTVDGEVYVDYQPNGSNTGTVRVTSIRSNPRQAILDEKYPLRFLA